MKQNMGNTDRYIRFLVGFALLLNIVILEPGIVGLALLLLFGLLLLKSSMDGFCPAYVPFGICTCGGECCSDEQKEEAKAE